MLDFYERGAHSRMVILFFIFLDFKEHITQAEVNLLLRSRGEPMTHLCFYRQVTSRSMSILLRQFSQRNVELFTGFLRCNSDFWKANQLKRFLPQNILVIALMIQQNLGNLGNLTFLRPFHYRCGDATHKYAITYNAEHFD